MLNRVAMPDKRVGQEVTHLVNREIPKGVIQTKGRRWGREIRRISY